MPPATSSSHSPVNGQQPTTTTTATTGPDFYLQRRAQWLTAKPPSANKEKIKQPDPHAVAARQKLEDIINDPTKLHSDAAWKGGIRTMWQGLNTGRRLAYRMPMALVIKITHVAWIRDKTWPTGQVAPQPDDEAPQT